MEGGSKNKNISFSVLLMELYHSSMRVILLTKQALEQSRLLSLIIENPSSLFSHNTANESGSLSCFFMFL